MTNCKTSTSSSIFIMLLIVCISFPPALAQNTDHIIIDIAHGQKFWNDPTKMQGMNSAVIERVKYMTTEITKTANSVNADIGYLRSRITSSALASCSLLFIHIPSSDYSAEEAKAITEYVNNGGSLFLVMDSDYWSNLDQTKVNGIIKPFGINFGGDSPDTLSGGHTKPGVITGKKLKVTYHGARLVTGGTPFCFNDQSGQPFGVFATYGKGKIIVMGDGMVSLYMKEWEAVKDYECSEFMHDSFAWLLKRL